jgi:hypothetical protein
MAALAAGVTSALAAQRKFVLNLFSRWLFTIDKSLELAALVSAA